MYLHYYAAANYKLFSKLSENNNKIIAKYYVKRKFN